MSVLSILGGNGGCPGALYLSETFEFHFLEFANLCQCVEPSGEQAPLGYIATGATGVAIASHRISHCITYITAAETAI